MGLADGVRLFDMKNIEALERTNWEYIKARGKRRFVRQEILFTTLLGFGVTLIVQLVDHGTRAFSLRETITLGLMVLPIWLLGGYLSAVWKWRGFEKKYSV